MAKAQILIVDDEPGMLEVCAESLEPLTNTQMILESDSQRALKRLSQCNFDLLITDIRMPEVDGVALLRAAREYNPNIAVLMLTAYPTVETAVLCMKLGAVDYLTKPFIPEDLQATVHRLLTSQRLAHENQFLTRHVQRAYAFDEMIGKSQAMLTVFNMIEQIASSDVDVLITGETGTGKELVARSIHRRSRRSKGRFVPVDCGAIPEDLLESEFFGHERGAFTGAHEQSMGLLEFADKGTFFLDEIGELPLRLQAKLLRVLQERRIRRVGGTQEIDIDVRVVTATSRNLEKQVQQQQFRSDLFYRINVGQIQLPALQQRIEDIPLLVNSFVRRYAREVGKEQIEMGPDAMEMLMGYAWPGNVRELQNVVKRTLAMTRHDVVLPDDLPSQIVMSGGEHAHPGGFFQLRKGHMANFEKDYLQNLLQTHQGDMTHAARQAHLPRGTLYRLLKKYQLEPSTFRNGVTKL